MVTDSQKKEFSEWFNKEFAWCNESFYDGHLSIVKLSKQIDVHYDKLNRIRNGKGYPDEAEMEKIRNFFRALHNNGCLPPEPPTSEDDDEIYSYIDNTYEYDVKAELIEISNIRDFARFSEKAQQWVLKFSDFLFAVRDYHIEFAECIRKIPKGHNIQLMITLENIPLTEEMLQNGCCITGEYLMPEYTIVALLNAYINWEAAPECIFEMRKTETEEMELWRKTNQEKLEKRFFEYCRYIKQSAISDFIGRLEHIMKTMNRHDIYNMFLLEKYVLSMGIEDEDEKKKAADQLISIVSYTLDKLWFKHQ